MGKTTLRVVSPETVQALRKRLKSLPKVEPKKLTKSEAIRELSSVIDELRREKGYSYAAVAEVLKEGGLNVSGRSIQIAISGRGRENGALKEQVESEPQE